MKITEKTIYDPTDRTYKSITPELEKKLEQLKTTQAAALEGAQKMGEVGIRGVGRYRKPFIIYSTTTFFY